MKIKQRCKSSLEDMQLQAQNNAILWKSKHGTDPQVALSTARHKRLDMALKAHNSTEVTSISAGRAEQLEFSRGTQFLPRPLPISSRPLGHLSAPLNKRALNSGLDFKYLSTLPAFLFGGTLLYLQLVGGCHHNLFDVYDFAN